MWNRLFWPALIACLYTMPVYGQNVQTQQQSAMAASKNAKTALKDGLYKEAARFYMEAYSHYPAAAYLYNAAISHERSKNFVKAYNLAKRARAQKSIPLDAERVKKNNALIARLEKRLVDVRRMEALVKKAEIAKASNQSKQASKLYLEAYSVIGRAEFLSEVAKLNQADFEYALSVAKQARAQKAYPLTKEQAKANQVLIEQLEAEKARWRYTRTDWRTYVGGTAAGIGVVMMVVGVGYFGNKARTDIDNLSQDQSEDQYNKQVTDIERTQAQGWTVLGVGAALTVVGTGLLVWDLSGVEKTRSNTKVVVSPQVGGGQASVVWRW